MSHHLYHHRPRLLQQRQDSARPPSLLVNLNYCRIRLIYDYRSLLIVFVRQSNPLKHGHWSMRCCIRSAHIRCLTRLLLFETPKIKPKTFVISRHRNAANDFSRRRSHLEPWGRLPDYNEDHWEGKPSMRQRPSSSPIDKLAAMFNRAPSTNSGEKSSEGLHARESFGTMQPFEKYHPDLAAEMASQAAVAEADSEIMKPPPARTFMNHAESIGSRLSGNMSPTMMSKEKMTPAAIRSHLHRWESAEVLHTDHSAPADGRQNPFADSGAVSLKRGASNPFFNAQEKPTKRTLLPNTSANPFADSHSVTSPPMDSAANLDSTGNVRALQSLIAALETSPAEVEERLRVISMQSSIYSHGSYLASETGEDAVSVTAFPYPPTQIPRS
ncbi:hypothetical protein F5141DRAFT_1203587 [Pisolithus sp. B1]|nr:hypothetical protein F5141DRAFT_1203587 [Pisolithus sp. B1]